VPEVTPARVPGIVKAAVVVTFFNTWVLFEETVVDRYGLWEYMPYYRVAKLCSWDIGALALIIWSTLWMFRRHLRTQHRRSLESGGRTRVIVSEP
jgi:hypothetical protein